MDCWASPGTGASLRCGGVGGSQAGEADAGQSAGHEALGNQSFLPGPGFTGFSVGLTGPNWGWGLMLWGQPSPGLLFPAALAGLLGPWVRAPGDTGALGAPPAALPTAGSKHAGLGMQGLQTHWVCTHAHTSARVCDSTHMVAHVCACATVCVCVRASSRPLWAPALPGSRAARPRRAPRLARGWTVPAELAGGRAEPWARAAAGHRGGPGGALPRGQQARVLEARLFSVLK